jgi:rhomboid protease GluP
MGGICFVLFMIIPKVIKGQFDRAASAMEPARLQFWAKLLALIYWSKLGNYYRQTGSALAAFMDGDTERGRMIFSGLGKDKLPDYIEQSWQIYYLTGESFECHWHAIVSWFQTLSGTTTSLSKEALILVARAFAEIGDIETTARLLERAQLPSASIPLSRLAEALLPIFCILCARAQVESIFAFLSASHKQLSRQLQMFFLARLALAEGKPEEADLMLKKALATDQKASSACKKLMQLVISQINHFTGTIAFSPERKAVINSVWDTFEKTVYIQSIVRPQNLSILVAALASLILACHVVSNLGTIQPNPVLEQITLWLYNEGMLDPKRFWAGEYWRAITYLFLHAHIAHAILNILGLYWFGRICQNIYGSKNFLIIYFVSGFWSALAHCLFAPETIAIGASGAVMGLFGAVIVGIYRLESILPKALRRSELRFLLGLAVAQAILDQVIPHIAFYAHAGGFLTGAALAMFLVIPAPRSFFEPVQRLPITVRAGDGVN